MTRREAALMLAEMYGHRPEKVKRVMVHVYEFDAIGLVGDLLVDEVVAYDYSYTEAQS